MLRAAFECGVTEDMGMTADQLVANGCGDGIEVEPAALLGEPCLKHNLKQQIAQLIAQVSGIATLDGIRHLVRFFDGVRGNGGKRLLAVPRAAAHGIAQSLHDLQKASHRGHLIGHRTLLPCTCDTG